MVWYGANLVITDSQVANKRLNEIFYIDSEFKLERPITDSQTLVGPIKFQLVKV